MSHNRDKFLARIKTSLRHSVLPAAASDHPGSFTGYTFQTNAPTSTLVDSFTQELTALSGYVHRPGNAAEAIPIILDILSQHKADRIIAWDESQLELPGFGAALEEAKIRIENSTLPADDAERQERLAQLEGVRVGLTGAQAGLADTGAIAVISGPGRGRLASLLPPVHMALLPVRKIYPALPAFLAANPTAATDGSNLAFIVGPSRSGDIEMTLSMGVHGPGEVHVVILPA
ncbi:MAG TPA: lactate utilization protein [Anaerolineae bacterium]